MAAALLIPAGAAAKGGHFEAEFKIEASHGYKAEVSAEGKEGKATTASLNLYRVDHSKRAYGSVGYVVPAAATLDGPVLDIDFGARGHVRVRFAAGKNHGCAGDMPSPGTFRGRIRLRGEHRFTEVKASKVHGHFRGPECLRKHREQAAGAKGRRPPSLLACRGDRRGSTSFFSIPVRKGLVLHWSTVVESSRREFIFRQAATANPASTFRVHGDSAVVRPRGSFDGVGRFADGQLKGDLGASFPGLDRPLRLTPMGGELTRDGDTDCGGIVVVRSDAIPGPPVERLIR